MRGKKKYLKPVIIRVELRPEEALLTNCKNVGHSSGACLGIRFACQGKNYGS
jgi:hypothetical protein